MTPEPNRNLNVLGPQENPYKGINTFDKKQVSSNPDDIASDYIYIGDDLSFNMDFLRFAQDQDLAGGKVIVRLKPLFRALDYSPLFQKLLSATSFSKDIATLPDGETLNWQKISQNVAQNLGTYGEALGRVTSAVQYRLGLEFGINAASNPDKLSVDNPLDLMKQSNFDISWLNADAMVFIRDDVRSAKTRSLNMLPLIMRAVDKRRDGANFDPEIYQKIIQRLSGQDMGENLQLGIIIAEARNELDKNNQTPDGQQENSRLIQSATKLMTSKDGDKSTQELARSLFVACMASQKRQLIEKRILDSEK